MNFNSTSNFQQPPTGSHLAILYRILDLGTQTGEYEGKPTEKRQLHFTWELPDETMENGEPFAISKFYTMSIGEKANLTKDLTSWLGKAPNPADFDPEFLIGKACQVIISEREKTGKRVVSTVAPIGKSTVVPKETHNTKLYFDLDKFNQEVFDAIPQGLQAMIAKSPEYVSIVTGDVSANITAKEPDATIPF